MGKPEIRFKGYTDEWEQRKLGEICESFEYGLNAAAKEYDGENKYIRITDIDDNSHEFIQDDVTSPDIDLTNSENYQLKYGDVLFARTGASVGKTYIYKESDGLVYYAGFLIRGRVKSNYSPEFIFQNTLTDDYDKFIRITSQRSGQPGVNAQEYASYEISVPKFEEQQKIGAYFSTLDHLITLHQRKCDEIKSLKKYMLQKMFPQNEQKVPEIRFEGFTEAWEQRKLGEVTQCLDSERVPINSEEREKIPGEIPYYGAGNIQGYINKFLFDEELVLLLEDGDAFDDFRTKEIAQYICGKTWVNNHAHVLRPLGDAYFLYITLSHKDIRNWVQLAGASRKKLVQKSMLNIELFMPHIIEQKKIGQYFSNLDHLITLHQQKCEELKKIKKFMLQKMFV